MSEDLLSFGVALVAATPVLKREAMTVVHDQDLGQLIVRRVIRRAWHCRNVRPEGRELLPWLLELLDQEKEEETLRPWPCDEQPHLKLSMSAA